MGTQVFVFGGVGFKARFRSHEGPRPMGRVPFVGAFLRDPSPYLRDLCLET